MEFPQFKNFVLEHTRVQRNWNKQPIITFIKKPKGFRFSRIEMDLSRIFYVGKSTSGNFLNICNQIGECQKQFELPDWSEFYRFQIMNKKLYFSYYNGYPGSFFQIKCVLNDY